MVSGGVGAHIPATTLSVRCIPKDTTTTHTTQQPSGDRSSCEPARLGRIRHPCRAAVDVFTSLTKHALSHQPTLVLNPRRSNAPPIRAREYGLTALISADTNIVHRDCCVNTELLHLRLQTPSGGKQDCGCTAPAIATPQRTLVLIISPRPPVRPHETGEANAHGHTLARCQAALHRMPDRDSHLAGGRCLVDRSIETPSSQTPRLCHSPAARSRHGTRNATRGTIMAGRSRLGTRRGSRCRQAS